jgi:L-alanine-DL-glutamate epimerase-like enolase superfamily enzyme
MTIGIEHWPLAKPFTIARGVKTEATTIVARISDGANVGLGESTPYARYGETPQSVLECARAWLAIARDNALSPAQRRMRLSATMPSGAARNALDCALWDLEAKQTGRSVADLASLSPPEATSTAITLSLDTPDAMAAAARGAVRDLNARLLKAKLGAGDLETEKARLFGIREAAPEAALIVDANEGWSVDTLSAMDAPCTQVNALFIEQPLPAEQDEALDELSLKTKLCADESCHTLDDLSALKGRFSIVNIKLDKTGGLTGAIKLREAAYAQGFEIMVGCMVAGSLAMAPAYMITDGALAVDLDGPLLLKNDRADAIRFDGARMYAPVKALWG